MGKLHKTELKILASRAASQGACCALVAQEVGDAEPQVAQRQVDHLAEGRSSLRWRTYRRTARAASIATV